MATSTLESNMLFWDKFEILDQAIRQVTNSLPSIFEEPRFEADAAHVESQTRKTNHFVIVPHIMMCDAVILLHSKLGRAGNVSSRNACLEASWRVMPVVRQILEQDMACSIFSYLAVTWTRMFRMFGFEYNRLLAEGDSEGAQLIIPDLKVLSRVIRERAKYFKLANIMIEALKSQFPSLHDELGIF